MNEYVKFGIVIDSEMCGGFINIFFVEIYKYSDCVNLLVYSYQHLGIINCRNFSQRQTSSS
jgi:hypothetical protein